MQIFLLFGSGIPQKPALQQCTASVTQRNFQRKRGLPTAPKELLALPLHLKRSVSDKSQTKTARCLSVATRLMTVLQVLAQRVQNLSSRLVTFNPRS